MKELEILPMKDANERHHKKKGLLFNLPMKVLVVGKSQLSGKTNFLGNILLRDDKRLYRNEFNGENIYLVSPSAGTDAKLKTIREELDIPNSNVFNDYNEGELDNLYEIIKDNYNDAVENKEKPVHSLIIFDDMSASGLLKKNVNGVMSKIFCNGRHILLSVVITAQRYADILTTCRENTTGAVFFAGTERQLEHIADDMSHLPRNDFKKLFRDTTKEKHSFFVVNFSNAIGAGRYMNKKFKPIG